MRNIFFVIALLTALLICYIVFYHKNGNPNTQTMIFPPDGSINPNLSYCNILLHNSISSHPGKKLYKLVWEGMNSPFISYDREQKAIYFLAGGKGFVCVEMTITNVTEGKIATASKERGGEKVFRRLGCQINTQDVGGMCG